MRKVFFLLLFIHISSTSLAKIIEIPIIFSSDLHGWLSPQHIHPKKKHMGLLRLSREIKKIQSNYPEILTLDAGDLTQGSPLSFYYHHIKKSPAENPFWNLFQLLNYDAVSVGNHDLDINPRLENFYIPNANFTWISSNIYRNSKLVFKPYIVKKIQDVKVVVLGLTTPGVHLWVNPEKLDDAIIRDSYLEGVKWFKHIQKYENPDIIIGLFHIGINLKRDQINSKIKRVPLASDLDRLSQAVAFDLILSGHDHRLSPSKKKKISYLNQTPIVSGGKWGEALEFIQVKFDTKKKKVININARPIKPNRALKNPIQSDIFGKEYLNYLSQKTSWRVSFPFGYEKQFEICVNTLNAKASLNQKLSGSLFPQFSIKKRRNYEGAITNKTLFQWFPYDNTGVKVRLSIRDLQLLTKATKAYNRKLFFFSDIVKLKDIKDRSLYDLETFKKKYTFLVSNYHLNGGGGLFPSLFMSSKKEKTKQVFFKTALFRYLLEMKNSPKECKNILWKERK